MNGFQTRILGIISCAGLTAFALHAEAQSNAGPESAAGARPPASAITGTADGGFSVGAVTGIPGAAIALKVRLPAAVEGSATAKAAYTFLMFKGIPEGFALTSGFQTRNTWIVSINGSRDLKMIVPPGYQGSFDAVVYLYRGEYVAPHESPFNVRISSSSDTLPTSAGYAAMPSALEKEIAGGPARDTPQLSREEEAELLAQGDAQLQNGNVVFARLLFEELVSHGNVRGLYALARTYDPAVLRQLGAVGIQGDAAKANELYRKAAEFAGTPAPGTVSVRER